MLVLIFKNKSDGKSCNNMSGKADEPHNEDLGKNVEAKLREEVTICEQHYGFIPR